MTCFNQSSSEADCEYPFDYRNAHDLRGERFVMFTPYYGFVVISAMGSAIYTPVVESDII